MHVTVEAQQLRRALKQLKARTSQFRSLRQPVVEMTAGGNAVVLLGTMENSASVPAVVHVPGRASIPLEATFRILGTYARGMSVTLRAEPSRIWLDRLSLPLTENS